MLKTEFSVQTCPHKSEPTIHVNPSGKVFLGINSVCFFLSFFFSFLSFLKICSFYLKEKGKERNACTEGAEGDTPKPTPG